MQPDKCPKCGSNIWAVEYPLTSPFHYDGTSEWACKNSLRLDDNPPACDYRIGRFCGQPLHSHEVEPPYCNGVHPSIG